MIRRNAAAAPSAGADEDTRTRLIAAARRVIEEQGLPGLGWRVVARDVGVSQTAPYRHFRGGLSELLAAVAIGGFEEMIAELTRPSSEDVRERVLDVALRYVQFGVERPHLYRALFSADLADPLEFFDQWLRDGRIDRSSADTFATLAAVKLQAFAAIVDPIVDAQQDGAFSGGSAEELGLALAAMVHGLVGEFIDEGLGGRQSQGSPWSAVRRRMSRRVIEILLAGFAA